MRANEKPTGQNMNEKTERTTKGLQQAGGNDKREEEEQINRRWKVRGGGDERNQQTKRPTQPLGVDDLP